MTIDWLLYWGGAVARLWLICILFAALQVGVASAQGVKTFEGCVDSRGQPVRSILDESLGVAFETRVEGGRAVIRYNPGLLPQLPASTRLFLFSHECARINLGMAPEAPRTLADARRADCWALTTLLRSSLLRPDDIAPLQASLSFTLEEWALLPAPPRGFDLPNCYRESTARPSLLYPAPSQDDWNACARRCADALLACQRRLCGGGACEPCIPAYRDCVAECELRFPR
jgi:hypothetical protein